MQILKPSLHPPYRIPLHDPDRGPDIYDSSDIFSRFPSFVRDRRRKRVKLRHRIVDKIYQLSSHIEPHPL